MRQRLSLNLNIGAGCFVSCPGCYNHFGRGFVEARVILDFLEYIRAFGVAKLTLGGGDPLTYPDILILLEKIKSKGFYIQLDTVGTPLLDHAQSIFFKRVKVNKIDARRLSELVDLIGIPLDGPSSEVIHHFRTMRENIFEEQMGILEILHHHGAKICINTVVHKLNIGVLHELPKILGNKIKIVKWQFFQFMPIGPLGYKNRDVYEISEEAFELFRQELLSMADSDLCRNLECKKGAERKGNYLFVDSDGKVWVPNVSLSESWDKNCDETNQRHIVGDIHNQADYPRIKEWMFNPHAFSFFAKATSSKK